MLEHRTKQKPRVFHFRLAITLNLGFAHIAEAEFEVGQAVELVLDWEQFDILLLFNFFLFIYSRYDCMQQHTSQVFIIFLLFLFLASKIN